MTMSLLKAGQWIPFFKKSFGVKVFLIKMTSCRNTGLVVGVSHEVNNEAEGRER